MTGPAQYCGRCGTPHAPDQAYCERCGAPVRTALDPGSPGGNTPVVLGNAPYPAAAGYPPYPQSGGTPGYTQPQVNPYPPQGNWQSPPRPAQSSNSNCCLWIFLLAVALFACLGCTIAAVLGIYLSDPSAFDDFRLGAVNHQLGGDYRSLHQLSRQENTMPARCITCKRQFEPEAARRPHITTFYDGTSIDWWVCADCDPDPSPAAAERAMQADLQLQAQRVVDSV